MQKFLFDVHAGLSADEFATHQSITAFRNELGTIIRDAMKHTSPPTPVLAVVKPMPVALNCDMEQFECSAEDWRQGFEWANEVMEWINHGNLHADPPRPYILPPYLLRLYNLLVEMPEESRDELMSRPRWWHELEV